MRKKDENEPYRIDDELALKKCLQPCLKFADECMQPAVCVPLFVAALNRYLYFFGQDSPKVEARYISSLVQLVSEHLANMDDADRSAVEVYYTNTINFIRGKIEEGNKYVAISLSP